MRKRKEKKLKNLPRTYIGGSALPNPRRRICFTGKGIKAIAKQVADEDTVVYESWKDCNDMCEEIRCYSRWSVIKDKE